MDDPGFDILLEDGPLLAVAKPSGVLTQAPPGIDSLEVRVKRFLKARDDKPGGVYLAVPHRLDRPVSGAMVLAKHVRAARRISEQFEARRVRKFYWACVEGRVQPAEGTWEDYLYKIHGRPQSEVVTVDHPQGRRAVLHYQTLAASEQATWLRIELETGRTHQVRVQAASRGWPVIGDRLYGSQTPFGPQHEDERLLAIALHARSLALDHPMTHAAVQIEAPLPRVWAQLPLALPEDVLTVADGGPRT